MNYRNQLNCAGRKVRPFRRLAFENLEDRRLLTASALLSIGPEQSAYEAVPNETIPIRIVLDADVSGSVDAITLFKAGIFFDTQYIVNRDPENSTSLEVTYKEGFESQEGEVGSVELKEDIENLDHNDSTDYYYEITWWKVTPSWLSQTDTRFLADLSLTLGGEVSFGGYAAEFTVGALWLNAEDYSGWESSSQEAQVYVDGNLQEPVIESIQLTDPNRIDSVTVRWNEVLGAGSYKLEYSGNDFSGVRSVIVTQTSAEITGLKPETTYSFWVTALHPTHSEYNSGRSLTKTFTTGTPVIDLQTSDGGTLSSKLLFCGEDFSITDISVQNAGNCQISTYTVSFYALSADSAGPASGILLGTIAGKPVASGKPVTLSSGSLSTENLESGQSYTIAWRIDVENDADPSNNIGYSTEKITLFSTASLPETIQSGCTAYVKAESVSAPYFYEWDFDADGVFEETQTGSFYLNAGRFDTAGEKQIHYRISDSSGHCSTVKEETLTITPLPKQIQLGTAVFDEGRILRLSIDVLNRENITSWQIDWGDNTQACFDIASTRLTAAHYYSTAQDYTIYLTLNNDTSAKKLFVYSLKIEDTVSGNTLEPAVSSGLPTEETAAAEKVYPLYPAQTTAVFSFVADAEYSQSKEQKAEQILSTEQVFREDTLLSESLPEEAVLSLDSFDISYSEPAVQSTAVLEWEIETELDEE